MKKFSYRFMLGLFGILTLTYFVMLIIIKSFTPQYYEYTMERQLAHAVENLKEYSTPLTTVEIQEIENYYHVTIIATEPSHNIEEENEYVRFLLSKKGVPLSKFWITNESFKKMKNGETIVKTYEQKK